MNIFDANTHIEKEHLSIRLQELTKWDGDPSEGSLTHYATVQDILSGMKKHGINRSIVMSNSVTPDKRDGKKASEMVAHELSGHKNLVGAACVHPYSKTSVYDLEEGIIEKGLKVLLLSPDRQGFELNDEALWILLERVEELKTPVMLHTQWSKEDKNYFNMQDLFDVGSSFHIPFILAHMGAGADITVLSEMADLKNIYFETSHVRPNNIVHAIDMFGPDRLIFGSDFSYNVYPKFELEKIQSLEIGKSDKEKMLGKNLDRLLK